MENSQKFQYLERLVAAMREARRGEEEIARCRRYAQRLLRSDLPVLFDAAHVRRVLQMEKVLWEEYHVFSISQGTKERMITAPNQRLKLRQRWILDEILSRLESAPYAHGFEIGRSIKTNALLHAAHQYVQCFDIRDYFPSIFRNAVEGVFQRAGYSQSASACLTEICCYQGALPQGAPTSPRLSNLVFKKLDDRLAAVAAEYGAVYSRYADDLTFSGDTPLDGLEEETSAILQEGGFRLNGEKTKRYGPGTPREITGLLVQNGLVRVPKGYKRALKQEIYYCRKFGVLAHLENKKDSRFINYREYLYGKAYYVQMIEPEIGKRYLNELDEIQWPFYG